MSVTTDKFIQETLEWREKVLSWRSPSEGRTYQMEVASGSKRQNAQRKASSQPLP